MKCVTSVLKIVFLFKANTQSYEYATVAYPFASQWSLGFLSHPLAILNNTPMDRWRKQWHPTPVLLPRKSHGQRSLVGCSPSGRCELDWATSLSLFTFTHWRRKWQPIPVFLPWESQGQGSLMGCRLRGRTGSDATEVT